MKKILLLLSVLGSTLSGCSPSAPSQASPQSKVMNYSQFAALNSDVSTDPNCDTTCQQRRTEFRYVVYVGKQIYCYWDLKKADTHTDFDALAASLEKSITTATSFSDYFLVLRQWASSFHDGHVNVINKDDMTGMDVYSAPIRVEVLAPATDHEKVIVSQIDSQFAGHGLSVGDEIVAVNGVAIHDALTTAATSASSGSTERMRRYWAGRRIVDVVGAENGAQSFVLTVQPVSGAAKVDVPLYRKVEIDLPVTAVSSNSGTPDTGLKNLTAQVLSDGIGYFRLDAFGGSQDDALISAVMDRLADTRGLILDLRHNGGGDLSGDRIIERLALQSVIRYKRSERISDFLLSQRPENFNLTPDVTGQFAIWHNLIVEPKEGHHYSKPVVALTSAYCFSACDTFSAALRGNNLATFIGEPTGGGTGTPLVFDLPVSPLSFRYSVVRGQTPEGNLIEGVGTSPDIYLEPTAQDRAKGKDTQLEKAVQFIEAKLSSSGSVTPAPEVDLTSVPQIWLQDMETSPTRAENNLILKISANDEL